MTKDEEKLIENVKPHILRCRSGDWEHAQRVVKWIKELGEGRNDLFLLVTAGYIHDIGWRDLLNKDKITFKELLALEPQANKNSEPNIRELLKQLDYSEKDIETILRLVSAADKHRSSAEDEAIVVDADQLSKLDINHLKEKFQKSEWMKMYELWNKEFDKRIKTEKARQIYPSLLLKLKRAIDGSIQEKIEQLFKIPFFKYFLPVSLTLISAYFWINFAEYNSVKIIGLIINLLGLILWWAGKLTLAQNWNVGFGKPKVSQLVTHSIYSKIRHPMYWGINLTLIGLALLYQNSWFLLVCLLSIAYFINRMRLENKYLKAKLGEEYENYKSKTWI